MKYHLDQWISQTKRRTCLVLANVYGADCLQTKQLWILSSQRLWLWQPPVPPVMTKIGMFIMLVVSVFANIHYRRHQHTWEMSPVDVSHSTVMSVCPSLISLWAMICYGGDLITSTHWDRQNCAFLQMTSSNTFSFMKTFEFQMKFHCNVEYCSI